MNPNSSFANILIGLNIFRPELLLNEEDLRTAVEVLEGSIDHESVAPIVTHAMQNSNGLEFILTAVKQETYAFLYNWICDQFPNTLDDYDSNGLPMKLLSRLHLSLFSIPFTSNEEPQNLDLCMRAVELAPPVLAVLPKVIEETNIITNQVSNRSNASAKRPARLLGRWRAPVP
ncbi:hypothetical protein EW146_g3906 [Bondarzewia mesenterica]|uniref:Uncharacterized protein n=1 Tax=Bondarzewia mesenterica TaxID=1095465 RepID=A0A4S4M1Y5_9AGAM|nr:hypothetical protein EW146_g3906 [Bondarzewia mesenterica]